MKLAHGTRSEKLRARGAVQERWRDEAIHRMDHVRRPGFTAAAANAQVLAPYQTGRTPYAAVSDFDSPYAAMPEPGPVPRYGPMLLPPQEVYAIVRDSGFSPLGIPRQRGFVYTIAVIDRGGDDGRLVIDARTGGSCVSCQPT